MKTWTSLTIRAFAVLALLFTASAAFAFYDPSTQKWITRDPLGETDGPNIFLFVRNRAMNFIDVDGRALWGPPFFPPRRPPSESPADCAERIAGQLGRVSPFGKRDPSSRWNHCVANCRITRECPGGVLTASIASLWHELNGAEFDPGDMAANRVGRRLAGCKQLGCEELCNAAFANGELYPAPPPPPPYIIPLGF